MSKTLWPEATPCLRSGKYVAWILSTDAPSDASCPSACAWRIHPVDNCADVHIEVKRSRSKASDEKRSNLAAAIGVVENLAHDSFVLLLSWERYVAKHLPNARQWQKDHWKNRHGRRIENSELWQRLLTIIEKRRLIVVPASVGRGEHKAIKKELKALARGALSRNRRDN